MTITSPVAMITADGITAPAYDEVLEYYKEKARGIFGSDINLDADTEDGQAIAIFAASMNDVNSAIIAAYNAYNPTTAIGAALDGAVKTNGISRHEATHSRVDLKIVGQYGTVIRNGVAIDSSGNKWDLPETVSIPRSGEATATATAEDEGAVAAPAGSVTKIGTPTRGWQSVTNPSAATVGSAVESDAELRARQALSTMQPTIGLWDGLIGSVRQIDGVQDVAGRHNDTGETSAEGIPAHSIALVVSGGDAADIASVIANKKSMGVPTYGSTQVDFIDSLGDLHLIKFSRPIDVPVTVEMTLEATETWLISNEDDVRERLGAYINGLAIGQSVDAAKCVSEIVRDGDIYDPDFLLKSLKLNGSAASVAVAWNEKASVTPEAITFTVV